MSVWSFHVTPRFEPFYVSSFGYLHRCERSEITGTGKTDTSVKVFEDKPENGFQHEGLDAVLLGVDMVSQ
jgi:hypothetical protein